MQRSVERAHKTAISCARSSSHAQEKAILCARSHEFRPVFAKRENKAELR